MVNQVSPPSVYLDLGIVWSKLIVIFVSYYLIKHAVLLNRPRRLIKIDSVYIYTYNKKYFCIKRGEQRIIFNLKSS